MNAPKPRLRRLVSTACPAAAIGMLAVLAASGGARAAPAPSAPYTRAYLQCSKSAPDDETVHGCLSDEYTRQDRVLNTVYRTVMARLDPGRRDALRQQERMWLKSTKGRCDNPGPDLEGSAAPLAIDRCYIDATRQRIARLQSYRP